MSSDCPFDHIQSRIDMISSCLSLHFYYFSFWADQGSCSPHASVPVPSPYQSVPLSPTMPPQTPTCHSNTAFSAFNACLSSLPHGAMLPTQYHVTPYCSATETYGHMLHTAVSPFSTREPNAVVSQSDTGIPLSPIVTHQASGFQGNTYASPHAFTTHTM